MRQWAPGQRHVKRPQSLQCGHCATRCGGFLWGPLINYLTKNVTLYRGSGPLSARHVNLY